MRNVLEKWREQFGTKIKRGNFVKKIINFIIFTCLFGLFFACNDITNQSAKTTQKEKAYIKFSNVSRNAYNPVSVQEDDIVKATLTVQNTTTEEETPYDFYPVTKENTVQTDSGEVTLTEVVKNVTDVIKDYVLTVDEGKYIFFLDLYVVNLDEEDIVVLSDKTAEMEIEAEKTYTINFVAKYLENGDFSITYKWPGDGENNPVGSAKMSLMSLDGTELEDYPLEDCDVSYDAATGFGSATYKKLAVPNGEYFLKVVLYDNPPEDSGIGATVLNTYQDYVRIYGYKTIDTRTLSLEECNQHFYINYVTNGGEFKSSYEPPRTFNPNNTNIQLPAHIKFVEKKFGESSSIWYFGGWYEKDEDGNESRVESIELGTKRDVTLYAKWRISCSYSAALESISGDGTFDYASQKTVYALFDSIISPDDFDEYAAQLAAENKYTSDEIPEGFSEVENGVTWSQEGALTVFQKYNRIEVTNTYDCTVDEDNPQIITKKGKYGTPTGFGNDDVPVYEGYRFTGWTDSAGNSIEELPEDFGAEDASFIALYEDIHSNASGSIVVNDGLLNLSIEQPDTLYMNLASITLNAQTKLDGTDLSLSDDVEWSVQIRYGGVDINAYGTEYYELLQTDVEIDDGNGETGATTGTKTAVSLKNRLEIAGAYQLFVAATYENVTSSAIFDLNVQENEYYEHSVSESNISTVLTAEMKDLIAPAIVVLKGELPSDNETLYSGICSALNEASNMIDVDMSQVSGITSIGTGDDYEFRGNNIQSLILPPSVETIGEKAFNSSGLKEITIPATVTEVASRNFSRCRSLEQFVISGEPEEGQVYVYSTVKDGGMLIQNVFNDSAELNSCVLVAGAKAAVPATLDFSDSDLSVITQIGDYAFYENSTLESIESFGNVTKIGESAFYGCGVLASVAEVKAPITSIGYEAFGSCYDLQSFCLGSDSITIGKTEGTNSYASVYTKELVFDFNIISIANENLGDTVNYDKVKDTIIPRIQGVESVVFKGKVQMPDLESYYSNKPSSAPSDSFLYNYRNNLKSITFDDQNNGALSIIGDYQLNHYTKLETVNNSGKIGRIGEWALAYTKIAEINLDGIMSIEENAFGGCSDLAEFSIDEDSGSNYAVAMDNKALIYTTSDNVNRLIRCLPASGITTLDFSSSELSGIAQIGAYAFDGCTSLTQITDWGEIEQIHDYAFNGCTELEFIPVLGDSSTESEMTLSENVFKECSKLREITIGGTNVRLYDTFKQSYAYSVIFDFAINSTNINVVRNNIIAGLYPYVSKVTFNKTVNLPDVNFNELIFEEGLKDSDGNPVLDSNGYEIMEGSQLYDDDGNLILIPTSAIMKETNALFARFADTATFGTVIFNGEGSTIGDYQFCSFENALGQTTYPYETREVRFNGKVTTIGKYAFYGCAKLDAIDLTGVEVIYDYAFANTGLGGKTIEIPASVYAIGNCAFMNETQVNFEFENPITIEEEAGSFWENFYKFSNYSEWKTFVSDKPSSIGQSSSIKLIWEEISPQEHSGVLDYIKQVIAPTSEPSSVGYIISFTCVPHN